METKKRTSAKRSASVAPSLKNIKLKSDVVNPAIKSMMFIGGLWAGKKVILMIDQAVNQTDQTVSGAISGVFGIDGRKMIAPAAVALIGLGVNKVLGNKTFQPAIYGAIGAAGLDIISTALGRDLLAGFEEGTVLPGIGNLAKLGISEYEIEKAVEEIQNNDGASGSDSGEAGAGEVDDDEFEAE